jgi:hypothetical protein
MSGTGDYLLDFPNRLHIGSVWLFISTDANGNEGMCATTAVNGILQPLIAADEARLESLRPLGD